MAAQSARLRAPSCHGSGGSRARHARHSRAASVVPSVAPDQAAVLSSVLNGSMDEADDEAAATHNMRYMSRRLRHVSMQFPRALSMDDFLMRVEVALGLHNFRGDNALALVNVCRDEATGILKSRIDSIFGASFNTNGLGACLTCGCLGLKAGFSHAPTTAGRERYVFFSFPHMAVDADGRLGAMHRPGRRGASNACGALIGALSAFKNSSLALTAYAAGEHERSDPEFSILQQRLAARIELEALDPTKLYLADFTELAERTITADLEAMIAQTVDTRDADYAVVTGVQVHSWPHVGSGEPTMEFVAPRTCYVVVDGVKTEVDLEAIPALSPRQLQLLQGCGSQPEAMAGFVCNTTVVESRLTDPAAGGLRALREVREEPSGDEAAEAEKAQQ